MDRRRKETLPETCAALQSGYNAGVQNPVIVSRWMCLEAEAALRLATQSAPVVAAFKVGVAN